MVITIDLMQLMLILLAIMGVVAGVFLIIMFVRIIGTTKRASKLLEQIDAPLTKSVSLLPELIKKADSISDNITTLTASVNESLPGIIKDTQVITQTARAGLEAVGGAVKSVGDGVSSIFKPEEETGTDFIGTIVNMISQIVGVVSYFTTQKKEKKSKKKHK